MRLLPAAAVFLIVVSVLCLPPSAAAVGEWLCYRGNRSLDARARGRGRITQPAVAWKQFVGALDSFLVATPGGSSTVARLSAEIAALDPAVLQDPRWRRSYPLVELQGRRQPLQPSVTTAYAHVLPDVPGLQKLEFESGFSKPTVNGQWQPCVGRCFAWKEGRWEQVWETQPIDLLFQPLPLVGDFDADGSPEVAILPFYDLLILDARTGAVKDRCRFTKGRSYGFFGVYDLDRDGRSEFVVQADFAKHVDVLGYRDGKLSVLWQREIELDISDPQKILRVGPNPVADVDGDGRLEVLVSLFNDAGDGRWRLSVHDGLTGAVKAELVDECLQGIADVEGDGAAELLTIHSRGGGVPAYGTISAWSLREGAPRALWQRANAAWQTWERPLPAHVNSAATLGATDALHGLVDGRFAAVVREPSPRKPQEIFLSLLSWEGGALQMAQRARGPQLEALALDAKGNLLLRCTHTPGERAPSIVVAGAAQVLGVQIRGVPAASPAVAWEEDGKGPLVVVQGAHDREELVAFRPPRNGEPAREQWRLRGRGQGTAWPWGMLGPVLADLEGGGQRQILYATAAPGGCARLVAADLKGREIWHRDFSAFPGTPPVWNTGGIILWQVGHFTETQRQDVLVTVRRSMMHSEETLLLSGRDGRPLWHRPRQISSRGVGGTPFAIADYDGDGLDDAASFHPSLLYLLKGSTGEDLLARDASWAGLPASIVYWGLPIAGDFEGEGRVGLLFASERRSMIGLIRADGSLVWWDAFDHATNCLPAVGDFDGDGCLEVMGTGFQDGLRCYRAATGEVLWNLPAPEAATPAGSASADLDGDGRDEALFSIGSTLYCFGSAPGGGRGELRWRLDLSASLGPPALADVEGRGELSVLVVGADGYVYCVR